MLMFLKMMMVTMFTLTLADVITMMSSAIERSELTLEYQVKYLLFLIDNNKYNDNDDALRVGLGGWRRGCDVLTFEYCPTCPIYLLSDDGNTFAICICYQGLQLGDDDDGDDESDDGDSDDDDDGDTFGLVALQPQPRPASWSKRWQLGAQQLALLGKRKYATDIHKKLAKHQQLTNSQVDNCDPILRVGTVTVWLTEDSREVEVADVWTDLSNPQGNVDLVGIFIIIIKTYCL